MPLEDIALECIGKPLSSVHTNCQRQKTIHVTPIEETRTSFRFIPEVVSSEEKNLIERRSRVAGSHSLIPAPY